MVPFWFRCRAVLRRRGCSAVVEIPGRRPASVGGVGPWARAHGFDYEEQSTEIVDRWKRGVMSTVGDVTARNVVLGQVRGEAVHVFDPEDVATASRSPAPGRHRHRDGPAAQRSAGTARERCVAAGRHRPRMVYSNSLLPPAGVRPPDG